jgi:hypothetical protein
MSQLDPEEDRDTNIDELHPPSLPPALPTTELEIAQLKVKVLSETMQGMVDEFLRYGSRPWAVDLIQKTLKTCETLDEIPVEPAQNLSAAQFTIDHWMGLALAAQTELATLKEQRIDLEIDLSEARKVKLEALTLQRDLLLGILTEIRTLQSVFEAKMAQIMTTPHFTTLEEATKALEEFKQLYGDRPGLISVDGVPIVLKTGHEDAH